MEAHELTCKFIKLCCIYSRCRSIKLIVRPVNLLPLRQPVIVSMKLIIVKCQIVNVFDFLNKVQMLLMPWGRVLCISKTACFLVNCASLFPPVWMERGAETARSCLIRQSSIIELHPQCRTGPNLA